MLIVCGIHARELFTVDMCLNFLKHFTETPRLLNRVQLDMILVANPMRERVLAGQMCKRKDAEGTSDII